MPKARPIKQAGQLTTWATFRVVTKTRSNTGSTMKSVRDEKVKVSLQHQMADTEDDDSRSLPDYTVYAVFRKSEADRVRGAETCTIDGETWKVNSPVAVCGDWPTAARRSYFVRLVRQN